MRKWRFHTPRTSPSASTPQVASNRAAMSFGPRTSSLPVSSANPRIFFCCRPDILVSESRAPDHCVSLEGAAVRKAKPGLGVAYGLDEAAHGYLPLGDDLGAADVDVVTTAALDQVVLNVDARVQAIEGGEACLGEGEVAVTARSVNESQAAGWHSTHGSWEARWANKSCENWPSRACGKVFSSLSASSRGSRS